MGEKIKLKITKKDFTLINPGVNLATMANADQLLKHLLIAWAISAAYVEGYTHVVVFRDGTYGAKFDDPEPFLDEPNRESGVALVGEISK